MAYNLTERFQAYPKSYRILDPGAYQYPNSLLLKPNKAPFFSRTTRNTKHVNKIWTDAIYYPGNRASIKNCSSIKSTTPRFPCHNYEDIIEDILCRCGIKESCECSVDAKTEDEPLCQGKVRRRLCIGPPPRSRLNEGLTELPSDHVTNDGPQFYDARVTEATAFYQGCKWSNRTSKRNMKLPESSPGPADYNIQQEPDTSKIYAEKCRAHKRKTSKQLRFIELVQRLNILENRPGPASYSPVLPNRKDFHNVVLSNEKISDLKISKYNIQPGPADHCVRRDFDLPTNFFVPCHVKLNPPAPFNVKSVRFKPRYEEGPSPVTYNTHHSSCKILHCTKSAFGSSKERFGSVLSDANNDDIENELIVNEEFVGERKEQSSECKPKLSWMFKSTTVRMGTSKYLSSHPTSSYVPQSRNQMRRPSKLQKISPFFSSDSRFRNWFNWIPVVENDKILSPAYYSLEKPQCTNAVSRGPLYRSCRFHTIPSQTPAPNEYKVCIALENILETCNERLKNNIAKKHKFQWVPALETQKLTLKEHEIRLFDESIAILNTDNIFDDQNKSVEKFCSVPKNKDFKRKLLRCFQDTNFV